MTQKLEKVKIKGEEITYRQFAKEYDVHIGRLFRDNSYPKNTNPEEFIPEGTELYLPQNRQSVRIKVVNFLAAAGFAVSSLFLVYDKVAVPNHNFTTVVYNLRPGDSSPTPNIIEGYLPPVRKTDRSSPQEYSKIKETLGKEN